MPGVWIYFSWYQGCSLIFLLIYKKVPLWQGSEYTLLRNTRKFTYARVLNIPFLKHKKVLFPETRVFIRFWKSKERFPLRIYNTFFRGFRFLKYNKFSRGGLKSSISLTLKVSIRRVSVFWNFFILEPRSSISLNIRIFFFQGGFFFLIFRDWAEKYAR